MIEARELTKRYGEKTAVDRLTFSVQPGIVTGFLGPNGAGKSTTMRLILGLDRPTAGTVTVDGLPYAQHRDPLRVAGALLEARAVHTSRSAYNHLLALAATHGISRSRVDDVIDFVGLDQVARKRAGAFSLGMGQRLGIASAILAEPTQSPARRAGQRARPRGDPVDPHHFARVRRRGTHRVRLEPPHERDGPHRRPSHRDRARAADGRHVHRRVHRAFVRTGCYRGVPGRRPARRGARRRRRHRHQGASPTVSRCRA